MNNNFFRFWRYIQRFALGTIIFTFITIIVAKANGFSLFHINFEAKSNTIFSLLNNAIIITIGILLFGVFGTLISNILFGFIKTVFALFINVFFPIKISNEPIRWYYLLLHPSNSIAAKFIQVNIDNFIEYTHIKSIAGMESDINSNEIEKYYDKLKNYLTQIKDYDHFITLVYQGTLTQEQRNLDNLEWDLESVPSLLLALILLVITLYLYSHISLFFLFVLIIGMSILIVPEYVNRKRLHVSYLIAISENVFQFGEAAAIEDRESI